MILNPVFINVTSKFKEELFKAISISSRELCFNMSDDEKFVS